MTAHTVSTLIVVEAAAMSLIHTHLLTFYCCFCGSDISGHCGCTWWSRLYHVRNLCVWYNSSVGGGNSKGNLNVQNWIQLPWSIKMKIISTDETCYISQENL